MFESNDTFVEQVVKAQPTTKDNLPRYIFLGLTVISLLASITILFFCWVLFMVFAVLTYLFWNNQYEYEYDYTNGSLVIAKIINNSKRKKIIDVESGNLRMVAAKGTNESLKYDHVNLKTYDCTSHRVEDKIFVLVAHDDKKNEDFKILFNPNEKLLSAMKHYNKRDIYE